MDFDLCEFIKEPSLSVLSTSRVTKDKWVKLAQHYSVPLKSNLRKAEIRKTVITHLVQNNILPEAAYSLCPEVKSDEILKLEFLKIEEARAQREHEKAQWELRQMEMEHERQMHEKKSNLSISDTLVTERTLNLGKAIDFVPKFDESDPEEFFSLFERAARQLRWPDDQWTFLAQTALVGRGKETYSVLPEDNLTYDIFKRAVLDVYDVVPETHRLKFRRTNRGDKQTYLEFAHQLEKYFKTWLRSSRVSTYDNLCQLILVEEFLRKVPPPLRLYLQEREHENLFQAANLAENYRLIHGDYSFRDGQRARERSNNAVGISRHAEENNQPVTKSGNVQKPQGQNCRPGTVGFSRSGSTAKWYKSSLFCRYCKKTDHNISNCPKLKNKSDNYISSAPNQSVPVLVNNPIAPPSTGDPISHTPATSVSIMNVAPLTNPEMTPICETFLPFVSRGFAARSESSEQYPVRVLRDTGSAHSLLLKSALPEWEDCSLSSSIIIQGVGGCESVPLARVYVKSSLVSGYFTVGMKDSLPVEGIDLLLGNDLAGNKVIPAPVVNSVPLETNNTQELEEQFPTLFPTCAVTRSMTKLPERGNSPERLDLISDNHTDNDFSLGLLFDDDRQVVKEVNRIITDIDTLKESQRKDPGLVSLFDRAVEETEVANFPQCFYLKNGVLMRKFRPPHTPADHTWEETHQIVVPSQFRNQIIEIAHDLSGAHLGVSKTSFRILKCFFWPKLRQSVTSYCKTCHSCQLAGKPNNPIKPAPLKPIPVSGEPFTKIIIDCVGPLPKTRKGNEYLLTIMCATTRFPEAVPLRNIKTKTIVEALTKFFTLYGIPKSIQSDLGTNFTSNLFSQVMREMEIKQYHSSAGHPQSQGALERFHQTLKSTLTKYCIDHDADWDCGVHYVLWAIRTTVQESLGFAPCDLVFGHEVRGPLHMLRDTWLEGQDDQPVLRSVEKVRERLKSAWEAASSNLDVAQRKMKNQYDVNTTNREFKPGDSVLALLPLPKHPLQCKFFGPYTVLEKLNDVNYIIATPDRRKSKRVMHINSLKLYYARPVLSVVAHTKENCDDLDVPELKLPRDCKLRNSDILANIHVKFQHLDVVQREDLRVLLCDFLQLFSDVPQQCHLVEHDVVLQEGARPIKQPPYRTSPWKREIMRNEVDFLLTNGLAERSDSEWASPCILVPKPDGSHRMCTDYRMVNKLTRQDCYPLPRMDDIIDQLGEAHFVTKIDLLSGYYQVRLSERAKVISAFVTPDGLFQYTVLPFGMVNAPATFQRLMHRVTSGLEGVHSYLDDLVIHGKTWQEHLSRLQLLFERLAAAGLTVNLSKSEFGHAKLVFLGHQVGGGEVRPVNAKVEAIAALSEPLDRKAVMRFLGMAGYYRRFVPNFADVSAPLTNLVSPKQKFIWTKHCQESFDKLKATLTNAPILKSPDHNKPFTLQIDACDKGIGAVLLQGSDSGILHPVCYASQKLKTFQQNYSTIEKECLALVFALHKFDVYLNNANHTVKVFTDHNPLKFLNRMKNHNQRLMRWALMLQPYNLEIAYIKGKDNVIADMLSRV